MQMIEPSPAIPELADIETASDDYAQRFAGATGAWLLSVQSCAVSELIGEVPLQSVIDVGGGHAQLMGLLCERVPVVTVAGSGSTCAARLKPFIEQSRCKFVLGDLLHLPLDSQSFDLAISVRFISHCDDWRGFIAELCRVSKRSVIIDYPPKGSFNIFYRLLFGLKRRLEGNTRGFLVFDGAEVVAEFQKHGFRLDRRIGEFVWPMVVHRLIKSPRISACLEYLARALGLRRFGSPVLAKFSRN